MSNFTKVEIELLHQVNNGVVDYDSISQDLKDRVFEYFMPDMPYGTAKARTGDPDQYISDHLSELIQEFYNHGILMNHAKYIDGNAMFDVQVDKLAALYDPVADAVWDFGVQPSNTKIRNCITKGNLLGWEDTITNQATYNHAARIAYLVVNPSNEPISIEFCNGVVVDDGNHRLAAAIYSKREMIPAIVGGYCDVAEELLDIKF